MNEKIKYFLINELNWDQNFIKDVHLLGGLNNLNFKVTYKNKPYFVRYCINKDIPIDRFSEHFILNLVEKNKLSPKIYYFNPLNGHMLSKWIDGSMPSIDYYSSQEFINYLIPKIKKIHSFECNHILDPFNDIRVRISILKNLNSSLPNYLDQLLQKLDSLEAILKKDLNVGLCHGDLNPSNILISNSELFIIDYEFSGMCDVFFDLATLSWMMSPSAQKCLCETYFKSSDEKHFKKLSQYLYVVKLWNATWSLLKSSKNTSSYDYRKGAFIIFEELYNSL